MAIRIIDEQNDIITAELYEDKIVNRQQVEQRKRVIEAEKEKLAAAYAECDKRRLEIEQAEKDLAIDLEILALADAKKEQNIEVVGG